MFLCIAFVIKNSLKLGLNVQLPKFSTFRVMSFLQNGGEKNRKDKNILEGIYLIWIPHSLIHANSATLTGC